MFKGLYLDVDKWDTFKHSIKRFFLYVSWNILNTRGIQTNKYNESISINRIYI